jgi:hypothetical protein
VGEGGGLTCGRELEREREIRMGIERYSGRYPWPGGPGRAA